MTCVIPTLAFNAPAELIGPPASPHPELTLKLLARAKPNRVHIVGVIFGNRSAQLIAAATHVFRGRPDNEPLQIWSAGCASGEEPYSIAMALERIGLGSYARVRGTDISRAALERANRYAAHVASHAGGMPSAADYKY